MRYRFFLILFCLLITTIKAQRPLESSADILHGMQKLNVLGNALYVAAHPDDENTRLIAWLENEKLVRTAYLSLTRGDGGQNLIGTEKNDAMGVLRTQELLEARKEDGGEQFFSRVDDFGYSKTPEETFEKWGKEEVLADVVYTIRKFQPDVIVTRFPPDGRGGHGHHTASSILAEEAFKLAADSNAYPEQLEYVSTWQAKRILWDVYWWNEQIKQEALAEGGIVNVNIGDYNEILGLSYSEIAADSRSQHKSQGFGSARSRGNRLEYLKHTAGDKAENDLFEGIDLSWGRIKGGAKISEMIDALLSDYEATNPAKSVPQLIEIYKSIEALDDHPFKTQKLAETKALIKAAAGIKAEALAENYQYVGGDTITGEFTLLHRSELDIKIEQLDQNIQDSENIDVMKSNELYSFDFVFQSDFNRFSHPFWLPYTDNKASNYDNYDLRCKPEAEAIKTFTYTLSIEGKSMEFNEPIDYKWTDRVKGEQHRAVILSPAVTITPAEKVITFTNEQSKTLNFIAEVNQIGHPYIINLQLPDGWETKPAVLKLEADFIGQQKAMSFELIPPKESSEIELQFLVDGVDARSVQRIEYDHILPQQLFPKAKAKAVKMDLETTVDRVGYIVGSGDEVPENLEQVGIEVDLIEADQLAVTDLSKYKTILIGIRAYNVHESMMNGNNILNQFVKAGGTVVCQYNTSRGLKAENMGPYPFKLSRNRVTKEAAEPTFLVPDHPIFNTPNKIDQSDFDNWVQERGLYFAGEWDDKYTPIIAWNDPGEEPQKGSILVADYGKGKYIYTGISFFRNLPAGVPGAFRLLNNMISYGHE